MLSASLNKSFPSFLVLLFKTVDGPEVDFILWWRRQRTRIRRTTPKKKIINIKTKLPAVLREREREMCYLTTHSTHFIYGYMASDIWLRTILIVRKETRCRHIGYSYRLTARDLLYAPSHRQDNTYHGLCYTSRGALAGTRNSSMGPPHERSICSAKFPIYEWYNKYTATFPSLAIEL